MRTLPPAAGAIGARHRRAPAVAAGLLGLAGGAAGIAEPPGGPARDPAERARVAAPERGNRTGGVTVLGSDPSETGTRVLPSAPNAERPWACEASKDGAAVRLEYQGEG